MGYEPNDFWKYELSNSNNASPPRGRSAKVYIIIMIIGAILGAVNETLGALFIIIACFLAWITS